MTNRCNHWVPCGEKEQRRGIRPTGPTMVIVAPVPGAPARPGVHQVTHNSEVVRRPTKPRRTSHSSKTILPAVDLGIL